MRRAYVRRSRLHALVGFFPAGYLHRSARLTDGVVTAATSRPLTPAIGMLEFLRHNGVTNETEDVRLVPCCIRWKYESNSCAPRELCRKISRDLDLVIVQLGHRNPNPEGRRERCLLGEHVLLREPDLELQ